jgi:hypothetical protein
MEQCEVPHAVRGTRGNSGSDGCAQLVPDQAAVGNPQRVEQPDRAVGVAPDRKVSSVPGIRTAEAEEIRDDNSMTGRQQRHEIASEVAAGRKAMKEDDRVPLPAGSGGVVVESVRADLDELSSHRPPDGNCVPFVVIYDGILLQLQDLRADSGGAAQNSYR